MAKKTVSVLVHVQDSDSPVRPFRTYRIIDNAGELLAGLDKAPDRDEYARVVGNKVIDSIQNILNREG